MKITDTALPEVKHVTLNMHADDRGFFVERYTPSLLAALGITRTLVQLNHSRSRPGVLRGIHFQYAPMQGKLVGVTRGKILDVAVDLRPYSPNFGKHVGVELSDENGEMLWIPAGFGHGFCVLGGEHADVVYGMDAAYAANGEAGVKFDDASLAINWPVREPILSERDRAQPTIEASLDKLKQWFPA